MKGKVFAALMCIMCLAGITGGTVAYFTDTGTAHNIITSGAVGIELEEWQIVDGKKEPYPRTAVSVMPGNTVSKLVCIRNQEARSYIRAAVKILVSDGKGNDGILSIEDAGTILQLDMNTVYWKRIPEDSEWWYYYDSVDLGETTEPLFTEVRFSEERMGNEYQNAEFEICVSAQAVQSVHNGESALTAQGWPEA